MKHTINVSPERISVIGLGSMGSALAETFLKAGYSITVWNRTAAKAGNLAARGAEVASTVADAIKTSPLIIVCVVNYDAFYLVTKPVSDTLSGKILVNLTNGTPQEAEVAGWASGQGAEYLDGGIMAIPQMIGLPGAFVLYSGSKLAFETNETILDVLADSHYLGAGPGLASLHDLALLSGMYGLFAGFLQAIALTGTVKVKATDFTLSMLIPWLEAMLMALPEMAEQIDSGNYESSGSNLNMQVTALDHILKAGRTGGIVRV